MRSPEEILAEATGLTVGGRALAAIRTAITEARAEALEEAAKVPQRIANKHACMFPNYQIVAEAIRSLDKEEG